MHALRAHAPVVGFVERDVVVPCDDDLELGRGAADGGEGGLVLGDVAAVCQVAGVEEDVGGGEGVTVGVLGVGGGEEFGGVGVGDEGKAGPDCCWLGGHIQGGRRFEGRVWFRAQPAEMMGKTWRVSIVAVAYRLIWNLTVSSRGLGVRM